MRVAVVCPYDLGRFGGVQDQAIKLQRWLTDAGHKAWLVGPGTVGPDEARLVGPVTVVSANGAATPISLSPSAWRRTVEAVSDADIVHIHEPFMPVVSQAASAVDGPRKVGTFHADPSRAVRRLYRVGGPLLRRVASRLDRATAVSPVAAAPLRGLVDVTLVPNGIDVDRYSAGPKTDHRVAFVGRDDPRKGLDTLLDAWTRVAETMPSAELVVVGADRADDHPGVRFLGTVGEQTKRDVLSGASVFCAPNTGGESFGIILAEAMASGCAVVASGLQAFAHVAGDAAVLVGPGDAGGLADAIIRLLGHAQDARRLGAAGLARVALFDKSAVLEGYLRVYEAALGDQR